MAYIQQVSDEQATGLLKRIFDAGRARAGSVANIIRVMSLTPTQTQASLGFYVQLMKAQTPLSSARKEMLATVVSNINDCFY